MTVTFRSTWILLALTLMGIGIVDNAYSEPRRCPYCTAPGVPAKPYKPAPAPTKPLLPKPNKPGDGAKAVDEGKAALGDAARRGDHRTVKEVSAAIQRVQAQSQQISTSISAGHASTHIIEFRRHGIHNQTDFQRHVKNIIDNPTRVQEITRRRIKFWDKDTRTVVVYDPSRRDRGTAFRAKSVKRYEGIR